MDNLQRRNSEPLATLEQFKQVLASSLAVCGEVYRQEISAATVATFAELLKGKSPAKIDAAFKRHLEVSTYFPTPAEILTILRQDAPQAFVAEESPCGCTKAELVALEGAYCEHGYAWGVAALRNILKPMAPEAKTQAPVDEERRRRELKAQAKQVARRKA